MWLRSHLEVLRLQLQLQVEALDCIHSVDDFLEPNPSATMIDSNKNVKQSIRERCKLNLKLYTFLPCFHLDAFF